MFIKALYKFWSIQRFVCGSSEKPPSSNQKNMLNRLNVSQDNIFTAKAASVAIEQAINKKHLAKLESANRLTAPPPSTPAQSPGSVPTPAQRHRLERSNINPDGCTRRTASIVIGLIQERDEARNQRDLLQALIGRATTNYLIKKQSPPSISSEKPETQKKQSTKENPRWSGLAHER